MQCGRVEDGRSGLGHPASPCFLSPLIKPDVPISGIRLSDGFHLVAVGGSPACNRRSRSTPSSSKTTLSEKGRVPRDDTLCPVSGSHGPPHGHGCPPLGRPPAACRRRSSSPSRAAAGSAERALPPELRCWKAPRVPSRGP